MWCHFVSHDRPNNDKTDHEFTFSYFQTSLPELWYRLSCQDINWGIQAQAQEPGDAPAPCQPSTGILAPNVLILHSFSCVSQSRKLNSTVSQGKTHFRFGATARTRLSNMCLCTCLGQVIFPLYSLAPLSTKNRYNEISLLREVF